MHTVTLEKWREHCDCGACCTTKPHSPACMGMHRDVETGMYFVLQWKSDTRPIAEAKNA